MAHQKRDITGDQGVPGGRCRRKSAISLCFAVVLSAPLSAESARTLGDAIGGGKANIDLRYRYEFVDQGNTLRNAFASTLRTRLGYRTGDVMGAAAYVEFEDVRNIGAQRYNSTVNGKVQYSVVPDPESTEVNQAYVDLSSDSQASLRVGRQRIIWDNARFVGNVGWRQNEQTYDGLSFRDADIAGLAVNYAYVSNVNTVTGSDVGMETHLMNVGYTAGPVRLTGYAYLIDFDRSPADSTKTLGLRTVWSEPLPRLSAKLNYTLEYARQTAYARGDGRIGANYALGEAAAVFPDKSFTVGYESLGGDGYSGFETPLATKHAFDGWADQFTDTPVNGVVDAYLAVGIHPPAFDFAAVFHLFSAQRGGADDGNEFDIRLGRQFGTHYTGLIKYARYRAKAHGVDTDKVWLQGEMVF
jgi:hypothetical protein